MNLEQLRAHHAFEKAGAVRRDRAAFLGVARGLPEMLQTNGLLAAWAFLSARKKGGSAENLVLEALRDHLERPELGSTASLVSKLSRVFEAGKPEESEVLTGGELRRLTAEAILFSAWLKRAAEALCREAEQTET